MEKYIDDDKIHQGHRSRMRDKLTLHGQFIFDTYELLEMLLYQTIPYRDTNPIAKKVKIADLMHNSDVTRLDFVDEWASKRNQKYQEALHLLNG